MFWTRLLSGVVMLAIAFASFWMGAPLLPVILYLISMAGFLELTKALGVRGEAKRGPGAPEIMGMTAVTVYYGLLLLQDMGVLGGMKLPLMLSCIVFLFLGELFVYVIAFPKYQAEAVTGAVFSFLYVPVMMSFIELTRMEEGGEYAVWMILICSWGSDTFAYVVGKLVGKKKIFPKLSPKKSLEGCIGGVLGAALLGVLYSRFVLGRTDGSIGLFALICALGAVVSMVGDLAASAVKRNRGIKDYGKLIPGHGGIMDRFDSVIMTAPMIYFLVEMFL